MPGWWKRLHWLAQFLLVWAVLATAFVVYAKLGGLDGYVADTRPAFSRSACLEREMHDRFGGVSAADLSDRAKSAIAAACAREEFSGRYSN